MGIKIVQASTGEEISKAKRDLFIPHTNVPHSMFKKVIMHLDQTLLETQNGLYREQAYVSNLLEQDPKGLQNRLEVSDGFYLDNNLTINRIGQEKPVFTDQVLNEHQVAYWDTRKTEIRNSNSGRS